ncbi:carboxypeptidase regulatory-like domain-containing protein [Mucilaginibacter sp. AW1-3]
MNLRKFLFAFTALIAFVYQSANAQTKPDTVNLTTILEKTIKHGNEYPIEKVYLHMDKPYYSVGDTIWFKAYGTIEKHVLTGLSRIVYVDVITSRDSLVTTVKLPLINGIAWGSIPLPQGTYKQGSYHLVAYTNWMRNFDPAYFFNKVISVGNVIDKELVTSVSLASTTKNNLSKVTARVVYRDQKGLAYANKKVNWHVEPEDDKEIKGTVVTDASGVANITINTAKISAVSQVPLITNIDLGNRKVLGASFSLKQIDKEKDVQFFPEGGEMISGLRMIMAFKAIKPDGLGIDASGVIMDSDGKQVTEFKSQNLGMGKFVMVPESGKAYTANVTFADGSHGTYDLPRVATSGINLAASTVDAENMLLKISCNDVFFQKNQGKEFYIIAQSGGIIYYAAKSTLTSQLYTASVAKSKFPTGIVQVTLFASNGNPVSERIVFIRNNDLLNLSVTSPNKTFAARQKVQLSVTSKNKTTPVQASLSMAVIDETKVPLDENAETTILTSLLLTSDLRGYIEKPNYYFNHVDDKTTADLDILMLTQGYRRFSYRDIIADKRPPVYFLPEQHGIEISGTLRNNTGLPIRKGNVRLQVPDNNFNTQTITDPVGKFKFSNLSISDSTSVTLNARDNLNSNSLMMTLDQQPLQGVTPNYNAPDEVMNIDSVMHPYLQNRLREYNNTHTLKEVLIKDAPIVKKPSHSDYPSLMGLAMDPDHFVKGEQLQGCNFLSNCLQTLLVGFTYDNNNFYITRDYNAGNKTTPAAIFYNGMNVDFNFLNGINANEIESIETFMKDDLSGINRMYNTNGVIVINGKKRPEGKKISKEQLKEMFPPKYLLTFTPMGYSKTREFYSPKYTGPITINSRADLRTTIYWNPRLLTDKTTGGTSVEFFNADGRGSYRVVVEGIDGDGNIGRFVYKYKVQ